jgi:hypothetical protein
MRSASIVVAAALCGIAAGTLAGPAVGAERAEHQKASYKIAGREVACDNVRLLFDRRLPSEGAAARGVLILNPRMLADLPQVVRLFVFHHECGHQHVGGSELKADCWAVTRGVDDGWLDSKGLKSVCDSFEDAPETPTHPSGKRRCRNIDQCFASAVAARNHRQSVAATAAGKPAPKEPELVSAPKLISNGTMSFSGSAPRQ